MKLLETEWEVSTIYRDPALKMHNHTTSVEGWESHHFSSLISDGKQLGDLPPEPPARDVQCSNGANVRMSIYGAIIQHNGLMSII